MKKNIILWIGALLLLIAGVGCEKKDHSESEIIATGTLIYAPTAAVLCTPRTHILKRKKDNAVVTIYGTKVKQLSKTCPNVVEVKKIFKN